jgi:recombination protein RecT
MSTTTSAKNQKPAVQNQNQATNQNHGALQPAENQQLTMSERFTNLVLREFGSNVAGALQVSEYQKKLIQGYFIAIDRALKMAEETRIRKNEANKDHKYDNNLPVTWNNVNLNDLALDVVHYAKMGLDMMMDNHLFPIPYKNNKTNKYDVTLMLGYNGIQYIAEKYAVEKPKAVTIELVYSTDTFKPIKKSKDNQVESYIFEINNPFDRGEIVGGFGYIEYEDPVKNKLIIMTRKDIEKRKPAYAAAEFWGGTTKVWENGKQVEKETDGWFEEMCLKTIKREVYSAKHIPRDPQKIDENYQYMKMREARYAELEAQAEIDGYANTIIIDTTPTTPEEPKQLQGPQVEPETGEIIEQQQPSTQPVQPTKSAHAEVNTQQTLFEGPNF